jgi:hypothetical protein
LEADVPGDIPHPSENLHWPAWFYPPDTREEDPTAHGRVFHKADDVPEGWAHDWRAHGVNLHREPPPPPDAGLTRTELKYELTKRDIPYSPTAAKAALQALLDEALEDELQEADV